MYILYILLAILFFGVLIGVHEFGHFITAKLFKVKVNEFAIGMGPALWKKQRGETLYALRCIPLGGYCSMEGEDEDSTDPRAFGNAKWWQKLIVLVAGATLNLITGFVLVLLLVTFSASYKVWGDNTLESVAPGSSVEGVLLPGDEILEIDGEPIYTNSDVTFLLSLNLSDRENYHDVVVRRGGEKLTLEDVFMEARELPLEDGTTSLRYGMNFPLAERNIGSVLAYSWNTTLNFVRNVRLSLQLLVSGDVGLRDMSGPVGIVKTMADIGTDTPDGGFGLGFSRFIYLGALIAVNLGVMNLLPIPALDGGRVVGVLLTAAIEGITKKKLNPKVEGYIHTAGMILLLALMAVIFLKDIIQIFR